MNTKELRSFSMLGMTNSFHESVLLKEVIDYLQVKRGEKYIDATLGGAGHTQEILKKGGIVLGIDADTQSIEFAGKAYKLQIENGKLVLFQGNFRDIKEIAISNNFEKVSGIIFDLGVSSHQLDTAERGFSFSKDALLDMRMDKNLQVTAADLINGLTKKELYELFIIYGEEAMARPIVGSIVRARGVKRIETTGELAKIVEKALGFRRFGNKGIHPATKIFQALRIAVNDELNNLKVALPQTLELLKTKGRLVAISFHSLEDRIVKQAFLEFEAEGFGIALTNHPIYPSEEEQKRNKRSRSAKMRVFEKK